MSQLTLYYAPVACSLVPYAALTEAGAEFEVRVVDLGKSGQLAPDYLRLNPKHKVPVLIVDGRPLTENVAILQWIAREYPHARLLPAGWEEFEAIAFLAWCAAGIHPHLSPIFRPDKYCDTPGSEEGVRSSARRFVLESLEIAERKLDGREWFFDDACMLPDMYFFWCLRRAQAFKIDISPLPNCASHYARMSQRPSIVQVLEFERQVLS